MAGTLVPPLPGSVESEALRVPEESMHILTERGYPTDPETLWGMRAFIHRPDILAEIIPTREQIEAGRREIAAEPEFAESLRMLGRLDDQEKARRRAQKDCLMCNGSGMAPRKKERFESGVTIVAFEDEPCVCTGLL